jgi:hypothetical protein
LSIIVKHNFSHLNSQPYILDTVCIRTSVPLLRAYLNAWMFQSLTILSLKVSMSLIIPLLFVHVKCTMQTFTTFFHRVMSLCGTELLLSHKVVHLMKYLPDTCTFLWTLACIKLTYTFKLGNGYTVTEIQGCLYFIFFCNSCDIENQITTLLLQIMGKSLHLYRSNKIETLLCTDIGTAHH